MQTLEVTKVVILNEKGEMLLVRRSKTDVRRPLQWDIPGGHVDDGEDIKQAVIRETKEEAGVDVTLPQLRLIYATSKIGNGVGISWVFFAANLSRTPQVTLSHEHEGFAWMKPEQALQEIEYDLHRTMLNYALPNHLLEAT